MKRLNISTCVNILIGILFGIACIEAAGMMLISTGKGTIQDILSSQPQYALIMVSCGIYAILGYILYWYRKKDDIGGMVIYLMCLSVCLLLLNNIICALFSIYILYQYYKKFNFKKHMRNHTIWIYGSHVVWISICVFYFFMKKSLM